MIGQQQANKVNPKVQKFTKTHKFRLGDTLYKAPSINSFATTFFVHLVDF